MVVELLRPFEREIIDRFKTIGKMADPVTGARGWKGLWIRGHLLDVHEDYVYNMWKRWEAFCGIAYVLGAKIKAGTYQAFRTYFHLLKQLGLVRVYRRMPKEVGRRGRPVVLYELVPERINDPAWTRPFQTKYVKTDWTVKSREEKRALRRKYRR